MKPTPSRRLLGRGLAAALVLLALAALAAQDRTREPLPLEVAVNVRGHGSVSPIHLSLDGEWVAHTVSTDETVPRDTVGFWHSATGYSFGEGGGRTEATVTNTRTGEAIRLGGEKSSSWGAVWSPDGKRVAFYSDEGGTAGVWIWDWATRKAERFPGVIARPFYGHEQPRWSPDGERLLVKVLSEGMTIAEANALDMRDGFGNRFQEAGPGEPSVVVRRAGPASAPAPAAAAAEAAPEESTELRLEGYAWRSYADLALLDLRTKRAVRLAEGVPVGGFAFSPDGRHVAYARHKGWQANTQYPRFDLVVVEVAGGRSRRVAEDIRLVYGMEWNWSPDGETIAYVDSGLAEAGIVLLPVGGGPPRALEGTPVLDAGNGEIVPLWDDLGRYLFAVGKGSLWRVEAQSGRGGPLATIPGWEIRAVVQPYGRPVIWTHDHGRTAWVVAREREGLSSGLFAVDLESGAVRPGIREEKSYAGLYNVAASEATGEIAFVSTDVRHMDDVWLFDTKSGKARQATHLNPGLERYTLGESRVIEWTGPEGKTLKGALLLPPGYREGQRLPTVLFVYGGEDGSRYVNQFGLSSGMPQFNFHILATRGYAVLAPDIPVRTGQTMKDIYEAVNSAADAVVAQGYADPERLAVMGQSYGSFTTLSVITQTPRFKAAVITAAGLHPDLFTDYLRSIGYYETGQGNMGSTIWEDPARYRENSPLFLFDRIQTPVLIGQGEKDGDLVPAEAIFTALERLGKAVEYRLYEGEGHVLARRENVIDFWQHRLDFLAEHLHLRVNGRGRVAAK